MGEPNTNDREAFAASLSDYNNQRDWYSERASALKKKAQAIDMAIIIGGALVAALATAAIGLGYLVAAIGVLIAVLQGAQRIFRYGEIWPEYRRASERMKRERRLFIQGAGRYQDQSDEDAKPAYVASLEAIIAEEQKIFFDGLETAPSSKKAGSK